MSKKNGRRISPAWAATAVAAAAAAGLFALAMTGDVRPPPLETPVALVPVKPAPAALPQAVTAAPPQIVTAAPPKIVTAAPPQIVTEPEPGSPYIGDYQPSPIAPETAPVPAVPPLSPPPAAYVGTPPWRANAVPARIAPGRPVVAVVIDDMGLDRKRSARTARLPGPLTLSWLPYAEELPAQTAAARAAGHELMLHLPMEPSVPANPGPDALLTSLDPVEIMRRLDRALGRFSGFVGVNNHMGSRFTVDRAAMRPVLAEINRRGFFWLDSRTAPTSVGMAVAAEIGMPWAGRDVFLDHVMFPAEVGKALARLEAVAKQTGAAVAIGHPHDVTIEALTRWLPELPKRGLTLVPLSAVIGARHSVPHLQQTGEAR